MRKSTVGYPAGNAAVFLATTLLLSCPGPLGRDGAGEETIKVRIALPGSASSRTIVPDYASAVARIAKLEATLKSDAGYPAVSAIDSTGPSWELELSVASGSWDTTVVVRDAGNNEIGKGELQNSNVISIPRGRT